METTGEQSDIVTMSKAVADKLDYSFSGPIDGIIAVGQVYVDLPQLHRNRRRSFYDRNRPNSLRIYRAAFAWYSVGIDYVQYAGNLHVIDVWSNDSEDRLTRKPDCVFEYPTDDSKYIVECSAQEQQESQ